MAKMAEVTLLRAIASDWSAVRGAKFEGGLKTHKQHKARNVGETLKGAVRRKHFGELVVRSRRLKPQTETGEQRDARQVRGAAQGTCQWRGCGT